MSIADRLKQCARLIVLGTLLAGVGLPASAVTVDGLYSAQVPVASSSPEDREQAYSAGLRQVLLRVSGRSDVLELEGASAVLDKAETLLQSYQFLRAPDDQSSDQLRMMFGPVGVNRALASINAPVWGSNRPLTLAWVAIESGSGRILLKSGESAAQGPAAGWRQAFASAAASRGLPLVFPPATGDNARRMLSEVWGQFMDSVRQASEAYNHDLLALVKVRQQGSQWTANWSLGGAGVDVADVTVTADSPSQLTERLVDAWADRLAQRYAVPAGDVSDVARVDLVVDRVGSLSDYAAVIHTLEKMAPVASADPVRVTRDQMTLKVEINGEVSQLEQYVALEPRFVRVDTAALKQNVTGAESVSGQVMPPPDPEQADKTGSPALAESPDKPAADASSQPSAAGARAGAGTVVADSGTGVSYRPYKSSDQPAEEAFESLYPTLHYRWQGSGVIAPPDGPK